MALPSESCRLKEEESQQVGVVNFNCHLQSIADKAWDMWATTSVESEVHSPDNPEDATSAPSPASSLEKEGIQVPSP